jgi:spermidine/putrescine-binding protein
MLRRTLLATAAVAALTVQAQAQQRTLNVLTAGDQNMVD